MMCNHGNNVFFLQRISISLAQITPKLTIPEELEKDASWMQSRETSSPRLQHLFLPKRTEKMSKVEQQKQMKLISNWWFHPQQVTVIQQPS